MDKTKKSGRSLRFYLTFSLAQLTALNEIKRF